MNWRFWRRDPARKWQDCKRCNLCRGPKCEACNQTIVFERVGGRFCSDYCQAKYESDDPPLEPMTFDQWMGRSN